LTTAVGGGLRVAVGGMIVAVGVIGVAVGGMGVAVGVRVSVAVGGTSVTVGTSVARLAIAGAVTAALIVGAAGADHWRGSSTTSSASKSAAMLAPTNTINKQEVAILA
jgi:hypothetical protein